MIQTIVALIIGLMALLYVFRKFFRQFYKPETNPKCENCPVTEFKNNLK